MFYTDWYDYDYQMDNNKSKVIEQLRELPKLMENDTHDDRPGTAEIGIMLDGLKEFYDEYSPDYAVARAVAEVLKKLCVVARKNPQYDKALSKNIPEYLELSSRVFNDNSDTLAEIKGYCEAKKQKSAPVKQKSAPVKNNRVGLHAAHDLMNILNLKNLTTGGWNTEYALYAIRGILTSPGGINTFGDSALDVCEMLAEYDFSVLNKKVNMNNEDIIIQLVCELLIILLEKNKYMSSRIRRIKTRLDETNHIPKLAEHVIRTGKAHGKNAELEQKLSIAQSAIQIQQMQQGRK